MAAYKPLSGGASGRAGIGVDGADPTSPTFSSPPVTVTPPPYSPGPTASLPPGVTTAAGGDTPSASAPPVTQPTTAPGSITTTPGYTPDYTDIIQSQPGYQQAQTAAQKAQADAAAQRKAALDQAVIQYGGLPQGYQDAYGDVDQATLDAAKNNQFSTQATLSKNYDQSVEQFKRALAARGALQSGDLNYGQDQLDTGYGQSLYDAGNAFGSTATGAINAYTGVLDQNQQNLVSALQSAQGTALADPANVPVQQKTASQDADLTTLYGRAIYKGDDGTLYTQDGQVFTPGVTASASYQPSGGRFGNAGRNFGF